MKLNCLIIDDEPIALEIIESYLKLIDQLNLIGKCENALEANNFLFKYSIDLIFLDIEMPHLNGLTFLKNLTDPPAVIITTAYRDYALEGFELNVLDYLLKPISQERFLKAVNRMLIKTQKQINKFPYIYLKVDLKMVKVVLDDILYIEGLSNYVKVFTNNTVLISYQKLTHLAEVLPSDQFYRSHRSYIVNIHQISAFTATEVEIGTTELSIGGKYKDHLLDALHRNQL